MFNCFRKPKGKETYDIPEIIDAKDDYTDFELDVMEIINYHRRGRGLKELFFDQALSNIALVHTTFMAGQGKASHTNFPIRDAQTKKYCKAKWLGECVSYGYGTAQGVVNGWLNSEGHRKILESEKATHFAISIEQDVNARNYFTLLMIKI